MASGYVYVYIYIYIYVWLVHRNEMVVARLSKYFVCSKCGEIEERQWSMEESYVMK